MNDNYHTTLKVTEKAQNNTFINNVINGGVQVDGSGNKFVNTYINPFRQKHPVWSFIVSLTTIIGFITGLMYLAQYVGVIPDSLKMKIDAGSGLSTTTPSISVLLNKALSYDTVVERQDFFSKYVSSSVYGDGVIKEISRFGNRFLFDITVSGYPFVCSQEKTDELEKQFYFFKGKKVRFYGTFTYSTYLGSDGLVIDNCSFELN